MLRLHSSWLLMVAVAVMAVTSMSVDPSALMGFAWATALIGTWSYRREYESHLITIRSYRRFLADLHEHRQKMAQQSFPQEMLN